MGTEERDWVDVANDLICKCHINLRIQRLTECDASVFVALYEAILGEKVPDYIVVPKSQEDDIHNVQSVIDSLALDYLQISLSHITGENIVIGDKDSIRNLLEIFDGLLEYLTEQLSEDEELPNGELNGTGHPAEAQDKEEKMSQISSTHSTAQSSKYSLHSWNGGESESAAELIRLGDSARTFTTKQEVCSQPLPSVISTEKAPSDLDPPATQPPQQHESVHSAIPLQPPKQTTPHRVGRCPSSPPPAQDNEENAEGTNKQNGHSPKCNGVQTNGIHTSGCIDDNDDDDDDSNSLVLSLAESEQSVQSLKETQPEAPKAQVEGGSEGARRVLFQTQPDVLLLSFPHEHSQKEDTHTHARAEEVQSDGEQLHSSDSSSGRRRGHRSRRLAEESEDPLSRRSQKNRRAEQELHEMSENLARRLEELDLMLKRALGETADDSKPADEDKHSHHSDSVMECRRVPRPADKASVDRPPHTRSLSPSPPPIRHSSRSMLEGAPITHAQHTARRRHGKLRHIQDQHRKGQLPFYYYCFVVAEAYEAELKDLDEQQKVDLAIERLRAQEAEQEYRDAIRKEASRSLKSYNYRSKSTLSSKSPRSKAAAPIRPRAQTRKTAPLRVKENDLLPALLDDFPPLQFSPHTLSHMWKQQLRQVDQLSALDNQHKHIRKHTNQKDFRERIQQQRSAQNKLREQRQQVARARKYHSDYHVQLRARLLRARTREERMFRQVFEEGLELQKAHLREQRAYAKEQRREHVRKHKDEIEAMENYYKDQFSMLAERLALERQEIQVRKKAQEKALHKMKRELRSKMEREISELQKIIVQDDEEDYFRELEVERLRRRVQMASFQYGASCTY
ncbi:hypothetical protein QTP86_020960 [Hemibagrus guttatus]|nr:hypothetical protein QTP86_020960 [Hemibagrus guttatus]